MIYLNNNSKLHTPTEWAPVNHPPSGGVDWSNCCNSAKYRVGDVFHSIYCLGQWAQCRSYCTRTDTWDISSVDKSEVLVPHFYHLASLRRTDVKLYYNYN